MSKIKCALAHGVWGERTEEIFRIQCRRKVDPSSSRSRHSVELPVDCKTSRVFYPGYHGMTINFGRTVGDWTGNTTSKRGTNGSIHLYRRGHSTEYYLVYTFDFPRNF